MNKQQTTQTAAAAPEAPELTLIGTDEFNALLAQRDELLAAAKQTIADWPGDTRAFPWLEAAIARAERSQS